MDQYVLEMQSSYRCFESFLNLTDLVGSTTDSVATEGFNIKETLSKFGKSVKDFFKRLWSTIINFWAKIFGKEGKLLNVRAANLIIKEMNWNNAVIQVVMKNISKSTSVSQFVGSFVVVDSSDIESKLDTLVDRVQKEVLNSPKLADYKYYKKETVNQFENTIKQMENTANMVIKEIQAFDFKKLESNPDFRISYDNITKQVNANFSIIIRICSKLTTTIMQAIEAATYKSEKENSKIEFEEVEVEIDPDLL